jgi:inosine-uridine nucleoside N-ribohydrolase
VSHQQALKVFKNLIPSIAGNTGKPEFKTGSRDWRVRIFLHALRVQPGAQKNCVLTEDFHFHSMLPPLVRNPLLVALFVFLAVTEPAIAARTPVILDTDIGTDIDDTWALAQLLRTSNLELKLVVTDSGDTRYRAEVAAKFLEAAGHREIPIGIGHNFGPMPEERRNLTPWVTGYNLDKYAGGVRTDGIGAMIDLIMKSTDPVTVIAIGPMPNLAEALQREPRIAAKCRLVGMYGSFHVGYGGSSTPAAEFNVKDNPTALRAVLTAPWRNILLTPLDTCGTVQLQGKNYHEIWSATADPMLRAVIESYCFFAPRVQWMKCDFFTIRSTTLFDCVAVYLAGAEDLVEIETVAFDVTDDGFTRPSPNGACKARVALRWKNLEAFETLLTKQLQTTH